MHFFCRQQVQGAIAGPQLGEAAHRLVKNTLNLKSNDSPSGFWDQPPSRNFPGHYPVNRSRPAGPSGYERGFRQDQNSYYDNSFNPQGIMARPRYPVSNGSQGDRQNFRTPDRMHNQEQYRNLRTGMATLTLEENVRARSPAVMSPGMPNSGNSGNMSHQFLQNMGALPAPPSNWIDKTVTTNGGMYVRQQETISGGAHEKQTKKVYQVKTRVSQDLSDPGDQERV